MPATSSKTDPRALAMVLLTILLIAGGVGVRLWSNTQRLEVPNFRALSTADDGRVFVVIGNTLYVESATGESLDVMPLAEWGVREFHGDLVGLADGSVILAEGRLGKVTAGEGMRMYARALPSSDDPVEGLLRCHPSTDECTALAGRGGERGVFRRAFGIDVDEAGGFLYVSEPGRHRVVQMTLDGEVLAASTDGWWFPNSLRVLDEGRLGFADTNHQRYVELTAGEGGFGEMVYEESILDWPDVDAIHRWPSEIVKDARGTLWMLIAGTDMADAWLYRYPDNGLPQRLSLPAGADPLELEMAPNGGVLAADFNLFRIHHFDINGQLQADFGSPVLKQHLAGLATQYLRYRQLFDWSLLVVLLVALPALGVGMYLQHKAQQAQALAAGVQKEEDIVAADAPLPEFGNLETKFASLQGEFIFWRKFTVLGTHEAFRFGALVALLFALLLGLYVHASQLIAADRNAAFSEIFFDRGTVLAFGALGGMLSFFWLSGMFERLVVTRDGIRYTSWLPGPLGVLTIFYRDWQLRWDEISEMKLTHTGKGGLQHTWRYEIRTRDGRRRRIHPLSWRLAGEPEVGIPLRSALRQTPQLIRDVIHRTLLFRLLGRQQGIAGTARTPAAAVDQGNAR